MIAEVQLDAEVLLPQQVECNARSVDVERYRAHHPPAGNVEDGRAVQRYEKAAQPERFGEGPACREQPARGDADFDAFLRCSLDRVAVGVGDNQIWTDQRAV